MSVTMILKKGQIYLVDLGETEGSELKKIRPCIIVQNDTGNKFAPTTIVVPITHRRNRNQPTQVELIPELLADGSGHVDGMVMAEQIRTVDRCRIKNQLGMLNANGMALVDTAILKAMGIAW